MSASNPSLNDTLNGTYGRLFGTGKLDLGDALSLKTTAKVDILPKSAPPSKAKITTMITTFEHLKSPTQERAAGIKKDRVAQELAGLNGHGLVTSADVTKVAIFIKNDKERRERGVQTHRQTHASGRAYLKKI